MWISRFLVCLVAVGAAIQPGVVSAQTKGVMPRLVCPNAVWNFGKQPQYKKMTYDFIIRNEGDGPLEIREVRPSCQCQAAMPKKKHLGPGEQTTIAVTFDTKTMAGPIHKPVTVTSNDPRRPTFQLMVRGLILPPYWVDPPEINLGTVSKGKSPEPQEFSLIISPGAKVGVRHVAATSEFVAIQRLTKESVAREDGTSEIRYQVSLKPGHPVGLMREQVTVTTDVVEKRSATIGINAEVRGEVRISPPTIRLGRIRRGQTPSRFIDVFKSGEPNLVIEKLVIKPPDAKEFFTVEEVVVEKGSHHKVKVSIKADAPARFKRARVVIMTNCEGERLHQAFFYVSIKK